MGGREKGFTVCARCGGRLHWDVFYGNTEDWEKFVALHCYRCGEIVDPVILENRQASMRKRTAMAVAVGEANRPQGQK